MPFRTFTQSLATAAASIAPIALTLFVGTAPAGAQKEDIVRLPEAENQLFTDDGRHFVSSGIGLYEFVERGGEIVRRFVGLEECGVNGLARLEADLDSWLIAACNRDDGPFLYAGRLESEVILSELFELPDFFIANGLEISPAGAILVADFNFFAPGKIARVEVDVIAGELAVTGYQGNFLSAGEGVQSPNGLARRDGDLFVTDNGRVLEIALGAADEYLGTQTLYSLNTTFDDLTVLCSGLAVTDFVNGTLILLNAAGDAFTSPELFQMPSSVAAGQGPIYDPRELIITERGIPGDAQSNIGNRVSKVTVPEGVIASFCGAR